MIFLPLAFFFLLLCYYKRAKNSLIFYLRAIKQKHKGQLAQLVTRPYRTVRSGGERNTVVESSMPYIVYVLQGETGHLYKGMTNDLDRRLAEHRRGKTRTTSLMRNLQIVYTENYQTEGKAYARERYLKTAAGRRFLKKVLGD